MDILNKKLEDDVGELAKILDVQVENSSSETEITEDSESGEYMGYQRKEYEDIVDYLSSKKYVFDDRIIRRYHLSLLHGNMVILSGVSGTGKTLLTEQYAEAINANLLIVPVAPNWTENEDLIGYYSVLDNTYHDTEFSRFIRAASLDYKNALESGKTPHPYHVVFDEMNLSKVEHYFSKFLSLLELRSRNPKTMLAFHLDDEVVLPPNLYIIGTVNVDESTEDFSDKVFDRAQLIELKISSSNVENYLGTFEFKELLYSIWSIVKKAAPFAYRTMGEIISYVGSANEVGVSTKELFDEQVLQKILPKFNGSHEEYGKVLNELSVLLSEANLELSAEKSKEMLKEFDDYGITSYF